MSISLKDHAAAVAKVRLDCFLASGQSLDFQPRSQPRVSILILVCNRAEVTLSCFQSLAAVDTATPFELILVDNGSTDDTAELLNRVNGATVIRNAVNRGYPVGVNQAAARATGEYLLLLNNDTEVLGRSIDHAVEYLDRSPRTGAVGGRIVLLDGSLQEAGCIILRDGWTFQFARGRSATDPAVMFERCVDYCSGAFLMVRRELFERVGGLDEIYTPGYFEDPELSIQFSRLGYRTVYLPDVAILHYESATSNSAIDTPAAVTRNHDIFFKRHADWLSVQPSSRKDWCAFRSRRADDSAINVLLFPPTSREVDSGRLHRTLERLDVMLSIALPGSAEEVRRRRWEFSPTCEVLPFRTASDLDQVIVERPGYFDLALLCDSIHADLRNVLKQRGIPQADFVADGFRYLA